MLKKEEKLPENILKYQKSDSSKLEMKKKTI
jgi:hypothetical protein